MSETYIDEEGEYTYVSSPNRSPRLYPSVIIFVAFQYILLNKEEKLEAIKILDYIREREIEIIKAKFPYYGKELPIHETYKSF